jgi:tetrahydromethanopterin S-methyltransferase subunit G
MVVMTPREKWTDERLDDLNKKVEDGFAETKAEMREGFARVDGDMKDLRREMDERFDKVDKRFDKIDERFEALNRALLSGAVVIIAALIGLIGVNTF